MNKILFLSVVAFSLVLNACKPKASETVDETVADSTTVAAAPAPAPLDSAAIAAKYLERNAAAKGANTAKPKKQDGKNVQYDADPVFLHHEYDDSQVSQGTDAAASTSPTDAEGYHFAPGSIATYPGGEVAMDDFLADNLKYPRVALDAGIEGTVYASVYVNEQGQVVDVRFPGRRLGFGLEDEVARVILLMPLWNPGMVDNAKVKSKFVLPVKFEIKD